jgi:competence protein ComEC
MSEAAAFDGEPLNLEEQHFARCSRDACFAEITNDAGTWRLLAIRSKDRIDWKLLTQACAEADVVVAERRLPDGCRPRWIKLDRTTLEQTGGVAIYLGTVSRVETVAHRLGQHPWSG